MKTILLFTVLVLTGCSLGFKPTVYDPVLFKVNDHLRVISDGFFNGCTGYATDFEQVYIDIDHRTIMYELTKVECKSAKVKKSLKIYQASLEKVK